MKILFIEDDDDAIAAFDAAVDVYNQENVDANVTSEKLRLFSDFEARAGELTDIDVVIVDMKLQNDDGVAGADVDAGNRIITAIEGSLHNIPVYIYTGTPGNINYEGDFVIMRCTKGEDPTYQDVIGHAYKLLGTGLMKIIGGKGKVQKLIQEIYIKNIKPSMGKWIDHKTAGKNTENILSRYIAACISARLESSHECQAVKEEMIMEPPANMNLKTGSIVKNNNTGNCFVILTPECDLVLRQKRDGTIYRNANFVLLCKLESQTDGLNAENIRKMCEYNLDYIYCLPKGAIAENITFMNFRNVMSVTCTDVEANYSKTAQILPDFTKEITQKFSSYYSRQGQPDFADGELCAEHCVRPA